MGSNTSSVLSMSARETSGAPTRLLLALTSGGGGGGGGGIGGGDGDGLVVVVVTLVVAVVAVAVGVGVVVVVEGVSPATCAIGGGGVVESDDDEDETGETGEDGAGCELLSSAPLTVALDCCCCACLLLMLLLLLLFRLLTDDLDSISLSMNSRTRAGETSMNCERISMAAAFTCSSFTCYITQRRETCISLHFFLFVVVVVVVVVVVLFTNAISMTDKMPCSWSDLSVASQKD